MRIEPCVTPARRSALCAVTSPAEIRVPPLNSDHGLCAKIGLPCAYVVGTKNGMNWLSAAGGELGGSSS